MTARQRWNALLGHGLGPRWTRGLVEMIAPGVPASKALESDDVYARADRLARIAVREIEQAVDQGLIPVSALVGLPLADRWGIDPLTRWPGGGLYLERDGGEAS